MTCSSFDPNCVTCTLSACTSCNVTAGYFLNPSQLCSSCASYNPQCLTCDSSNCLSCSSGSFLTSTGNCQTCSIYGQQCVDCNQVTCLTCSSGFTVHQNTCQNLNPVCGDGLWMESQESCDDGNLNDFDGCNHQCQIEQDYECLLIDKLPSGASNCKFTKNITIDVLMM